MSARGLVKVAGRLRGRGRMVTTCSHVGVAAFDDRLFSLAKRRLCPFSQHAPKQKKQTSRVRGGEGEENAKAHIIQIMNVNYSVFSMFMVHAT